MAGARHRGVVGVAALAAVVLLIGPGRSVLAAIVPGGAPRAGIDNFGRFVNPQGRLTELGYFVTGSALTPDGRFLWTVGAGRIHNDIQITRTADGRVIQTIDAPNQALQGGIAISHDGLRAYVSDTHDDVGVRTFRIDPRTGLAEAGPSIPLPPPTLAVPPDDFPPRTPGTAAQSYAAGLALTADDRKLVVAENLADHAAVIDTASRAVAQVQIRLQVPDSGDHALPQGVAIIGHTAYIADEGDGTVASFDVDNPSAGVSRVTPTPQGSDPASIDPTKTHPFQIVAAPDGHSLYLTESNADRVLVLDPANLGVPRRTIYLRRAEGIGTTPLGLDVSPDGATLFVADANEEVVRAIALVGRDIALPAGGSTHIAAGAEIARIPTGIYPARVHVDPRGGRLFVVSAEGTGAGPTNNISQPSDHDSASHRLLGVLQTLPLPLDAAARDTQLAADGAGGQSAPVPVASAEPAPAGTPVVGPGGGPSAQIKYVFYVVAENKTYDTQLGDLTRDPAHPLLPGSQPVGNGNPCLTVFGETRSLPHNFDGTPCPQSRFVSKDTNLRVNPGQVMDGTPITPNQHKLARQFVDLTNAYANSTTSDDGHLLTASGYASDYELRGTEANNGPSPRPFDLIYPQAAPPQGFLFDAFARAGVSFFNYGEAASGTLIPDIGLNPAEQVIRKLVTANSDYLNYPSSAAIDCNPVSVGPGPILSGGSLSPGTCQERVDDADQEPADSTNLGTSVPPRQSRLLYFKRRFGAEVSSPGCQLDPADPTVCPVPQFNALVLPNNHTGGTTPGRRTPDALVRDNDLAIGQLVDTISHSPIWPHTAIFIFQDDAQDSADHVEAHRIVTFVASPYARHQAVVSTHYDQLSIIHTAEMMLGVRPVYMYDALATPMYDAFQSTPDNTPYNLVDIPTPLLDELNTSRSPMAQVSAAQTWSADRVNPNLVNKIMWAYRYGTAAACPSGVGLDQNNPCRVAGGGSGG